MVEVWARSEHGSSRGVRSKFFIGWESIRRFPGGGGFQRAYSYDSFFCGEIMTRTQAQQQQQQQQQCTKHAITNWLQRYNVTAPSSSSQHHASVTDPRCTVSSCIGKHVRAVTHHIYLYQLSLGCCFCSSSSGTKPRHNHTQQQQYKEHATTSIPIAPSSSRQRHARITDTYALYTLYSVKLFCRT